MARLKAAEFDELIECLVEDLGLPGLRERLIRANAVVSRRAGGSVASLSRQLYQLTIGLEKDGLPSRVLLALWEERLAGGADEKSTERLDEIAARVNECLDADGHPLAGREGALRDALASYRSALAERVGERVARLTMLLRAYPDVAGILRADLDRESRESAREPPR